jgi:ribosomal-protein-alanine N-acetyltransferase
MTTILETNRLLLNELSANDFEFIFELLNTQEWIQFIGNRNINTHEDAKAYIQKIKGNPDIQYWTVTLKDEKKLIGVITFIKRDYLDNSDIGFAFLPNFTKKGYAFEATKAVLNEVTKNDLHKRVLATTLKENQNSIQLLEKLGLAFDKTITVESEELLLFAMVTE